ncbi:hypothetical protein DL96DRAFT_1703973 [Flagelloscypha sp. PMI_526]|nr:hypothetical protein DL96DRAFT_1703973 [Flagelloscypha sp. PMI_526]
MAQCVTQAVATVTNIRTEQNVHTSFSESVSALEGTVSTYTTFDSEKNVTLTLETRIPGGQTTIQVPIVVTDVVTQADTSISYTTSCSDVQTTPTTPVTTPETTPTTTPTTTPQTTPTTTPETTPTTTPSTTPETTPTTTPSNTPETTPSTTPETTPSTTPSTTPPTTSSTTPPTTSSTTPPTTSSTTPPTTSSTTPTTTPWTPPATTPWTPPATTHISILVTTRITAPLTTTFTTTSAGRTFVYPTVLLPDTAMPSATSSSHSNNVAAIVGGSIGGLVGLAVLIGAVYYMMKIKMKSNSVHWGEEFDSEYVYDKNGLGGAGASHGHAPAASHPGAAHLTGGDGLGGAHAGFIGGGEQIGHTPLGGNGVGAHGGFGGGEQVYNMGGHGAPGAGQGLGGQGFSGQGFGGEHSGYFNGAPGESLGSHGAIGGGGEQIGHLGGHNGLDVSQSLAQGSSSISGSSTQVFQGPVVLAWNRKKAQDDKHLEIKNATEADDIFDPYLEESKEPSSPPQYSFDG